jgi:hypothetical protein
MAFLNFLITASTDSAVIGPVTNWSSNSDGISGKVAVNCAVVLVLA